MKVLFVAHVYDYGIPARGHSFEYYNFYESLVAMGFDVTVLDLGLARSLGREALNDRLWQIVQHDRPDLMFATLFEDELESDVVSRVSTSTDTVTFNWFADDHWRFESFTRHWAPCFNWVSTTASSALPKYAELGQPNVIKTQWAAADSVYQPRGLPLRYDVTFVGQRYGDRPDTVKRVSDAGLEIRAWGTGWGVQPWHRAASRLPIVKNVGGRRWRTHAEVARRLSQAQMIDIFEQSRINVNLSEGSQGSETQIKGRVFEVPACRGFLLTGHAQGIEEYLEPGREVVVYDDVEDLISKARHYLRHEHERATIAEAGYKRVMAEHTYRHRFAEIFSRMGILP